MWIRRVLLFCLTTCSAIAPAQTNLALQAKASASEFQAGLPPQLGNDGNLDTRWSGIPGHNSGVWYQLAWDRPVTVGEVLIRQYQRYTFEMDVQVWDEATNDWRTVRHFGKPGVHLTGLVLCPIDPPVQTSRVRIANITNGPSFTEVEVYASPKVHPPVITLASDLQGNFVGMVCDGVGAMPVAGKTVHLQGQGWSAEATSDEHGLFWVKMPVGLRGTVTASADGIQPRTYDAAFFQRSITPIDESTPPTQLDNGWKFKVDPPKGFENPTFNDRGWSPIKVPAHWEMEGFESPDGIGGYRLHFRRPPGSGRLMLRFDGVYSGADVWVNGHHCAYHEGGFTPFEIDVTDLVRPGDNVLALKVAEHTNVSDNLDKMSQYAYFHLAGIMRKVTLFRVPDIYVEAYSQSTRFDKALASISGSLAVLNRTSQVAGMRAAISLLDANGHAVARTTAAVAIHAMDRQSTVFSLRVPHPHGWNAEDPYLYTLKIDLTRNGKTVQTLGQQIGLRQTTIDGSRLLINGTPVKFRGTCHHDQYPTMGRAVTPEIERKDVAMIKEANLNALRTSHYPPMPELIDAADKQGLYVEDEADFCWVGVADDLRNAPRILQLEGELLARDRNHPSVFMWSLCNESDFGYDFERAHEWVRKTDPSRPNGAATSAWLEIATLHNPITIKRIQENENLDKPLFFDEAWCIYQGIFNDVGEMWVDPGVRDYYAEPLPGIWDAFMKSQVTQGSMIWAWSDDIFCVPHRGYEYGRENTRSHFIENEYALPGRGLVGDAPWGVVDGWRRRKPEFWITKKLQSPVKVVEGTYDPNRPTRVPIHNEYDFTNLVDLVVTYRAGSKSGALHPNVPPRSKATITIPALRRPGPLVVTFKDKRGNLIDQFAFEEPRKPFAHPSGPAIAMSKESNLGGDTTRLVGRGFEMAFETPDGYLRQCVVGGRQLLLDTPCLHVLPTDAPNHPIPDRNAWRASGMDVSKRGQDVVATLEGSYPDFTGKYVLTITPGGGMTVHSSFKYTGKPILAREVGLSFPVPKGCDVLSWDRKAEWNVYPADHIGRPKGTASAFATHPLKVPPTWPWSQDDSPMGSNDFRSTKRHIYSGSIAYPSGEGILIESDGGQALRAMVESDRIEVNVSDWYGGTNVGWNEWILNYGRGKQINTGDILESTLRLRLRPGSGAARF